VTEYALAALTVFGPPVIGVTVLVGVGAMVIVVLGGEIERMTANEKERKP
jgi:hypothetical protein